MEHFYSTITVFIVYPRHFGLSYGGNRIDNIVQYYDSWRVMLNRSMALQ